MVPRREIGTEVGASQKSNAAPFRCGHGPARKSKSPGLEGVVLFEAKSAERRSGWCRLSGAHDNSLIVEIEQLKRTVAPVADRWAYYVSQLGQ